jgi:hypothetical protein
MSQTKAQLLDNIKDNVQLDAQKALRFADSDSSHYVAFRAPGTVSSSVTWTLPAADGSANYVLATDGSGNLSWIADPAGQWVTSGSNVYYTAGNVGIGDNSPSNPLSVTGASAFNGDVQFTGASYNVTWDKSADDLIFNDNAKACFGTGSDLQIYHDGSHSQVKDAGSGGLHFWSGDYRFYNAAGSEYLLRATENGEVQIYHDNGEKLNTVTDGINLTGSLQFGDDNDTHLSRPAANALAITTGGTERVRFDSNGRLGIGVTSPSRTLDIQSASNENGFSLNCIGTPANYFFDIRDDGTTVLRVDSSGNLEIPSDSGKLYLGAGNDLQIYHDGSNSYIDNHVGALTLRGDSEIIYIKPVDNENSIVCKPNAEVEICYDGSQKLETTSGGISVTGQIVLTDAVKFADHTSSTTGMAVFGADNDMKIYHNNTKGAIQCSTGELLIRAGGLNVKNEADNETFLVCNDNGAVNLYFNNVLKAKTYTDGWQVNGDFWIDNQTNTGRDVWFDESADTFKFYDNVNATFGTGNDVKIWHDGSNSFITNDTGYLLINNLANNDLVLRAANDVFIQPQGGENGVKVIGNGAVELYQDSSKKLETNSDGIAVTGTCDAARFTATEGSGWDYDERVEGNINIPHNSFTTIDANYGWALPAAGKYLLVSSMRVRLWGVSGFIHCRLYDTTNSAAITATTRMMFEQGNSTAPMGQYNSQVTLHWVHTCSGAVTINQQFSTNNDSTNTSIQDDTNGHNYTYWQRIG